jgi:hypothetical protein
MCLLGLFSLQTAVVYTYVFASEYQLMNTV